ncbi:MFS transporter [Cyanobacterium aponinum UTEX 3222]|uniref:MFS transporter n=1 Tax=Cyanobacterium aponinum TaxID=379064 RepID=UPI0030915DE7|nr:MFS transporter [Cyanobacterium aponinum UTEX 3222]
MVRKFLIIWSGQLLSTIGSNMTNFALTIWAWEKTGTATALAFISFAFLAPNLITGLFMGVIVDRFERKLLMILGDIITGTVSVILLLIYTFSSLEIWHIYLLIAITSPFSQLQSLASETITADLVTPENYIRAGSLTSILNYGSQIVAPALAGFLYPIISLTGILFIDLFTLILAIFTVIITPIKEKKIKLHSNKITDNLTEIFIYLKENKYFLTIITIEILFWFIHDIGGSIFKPLILSRTDGNTFILGSISASAGIGGVMGGLIITFWGKIKNRFKGFIIGIMGASICKLIFGFGQSILIWLPLQFCSSLNFPLIYSTRQGLYLDLIPSNLQGRIFAFSNWLRLGVGAISALLGGILADRIFEPWMMTDNIFSPLFGTQKGAGMSLLYVLCSVGMFFVGLWGHKYQRRNKP